MDVKMQEAYAYLKKLLDDNGIGYIVSDFGLWKSITIEPNDIKGSHVEAIFSNAGIIIKYSKENQVIQKETIGTIDELIGAVSNIVKIKIRKEYTDFIKILDNNRIDYIVSTCGVWKMITIEPNDITGSHVEAHFSDEGIEIKNCSKNEEKPIRIKNIHELIETVSAITKIDIKEAEATIDPIDELERGAIRR